jgi:predicted nucleotidyltransferase
MKGLNKEEKKKIIPSGTILLGYRGSIAHGTYVPSSDKEFGIDDKDIMGICIPELNTYLGFGKFEQKEVKYKEWDSVVYELRKYFRLLLKSNPNVLSLLWLEPNMYIIRTEIGRQILENRDLFVSKQAYHSFNGYAYGQFKRMTHFTFEGYMGEKRKQLVEKFGYDTKNAAHLIRLLRMGTEYLIEGRLYVHRKDGDQLLSIKRGEWSLEQVKAEAEHLFKRAEEAYTVSKLPNEPDYKEAERLLMSIIMEHFNIKLRR